MCQSVIGNLIGQATPPRLFCFCLYICVPSREGERRGACSVVFGIHERKRPVGRPKLRWESNVRMDLNAVVWEGEDLYLSGLGYGQVAGFCEDGNISPGS